MAKRSQIPPALIIAGAASGTGKTTVTMAIIAALRSKGVAVAAAKTGPDYIDGHFLSAASQYPCLNLDPWAMTPTTLRARLAEHSAGSDLTIIEGVMGLYDGAIDGTGTTADLADALGAPVILVLDASRQNQSIAAIAHGFCTFRPGVNVAGIIATRLASSRHTAMVREAFQAANLPLIAALPNDPALSIPSRHLGLVQAREQTDLDALLETAANWAALHINVKQLQTLAQSPGDGGERRPIPPLGQRIAITCDDAFTFSYAHMLSDWRTAGAEISFFSPLANEAPPTNADAVFLTGGYPELHGAQLAAADHFRSGLRKRAESGATIYGECGGYMVLGRALVDANGTTHLMTGLLDHVATFADQKRQIGYRRLETIAPAKLPQRLMAHEHHRSQLAEAGTDGPLFDAFDGVGQSFGPIGGQRGNVFGSYAHIIDLAPLAGNASSLARPANNSGPA